jgi:transcriptional regulator with XRE-family HTH domain
MSRRELADATGLTEATISYYINKRKMPGLKAIINIAYAFDISVDELIDFGEMIR